jgi:hypothetical protein
MTSRQIKVSPEHPEADVRHIVRGIVRQGLKPVSSKTSISLRVDADVLEWFKAQGGNTKPGSMPFLERSTMPRSNNALERPGNHRGRAVLAMNCVLGTHDFQQREVS